MHSTVILDILVAGLLAATLYYCLRLDRRLRAFRAGHDDMREVVAQLDSATEKARLSIENLKAVAADAGDQLEKRAKGATTLLDELKVIVETGDNLANRLEARLTGAARSQATERMNGAGADALSKITAMPRPPAREERILRALREAR